MFHGANVHVFRFDADGALDPGFGTDGVVSPLYSFTSSEHGIAVDSSDRIVVFTRSGFVRILSDGELDAQYGAAGVGTTAMIRRYGFAVADDGAVIAVGMIASDEGTGWEGAVARAQPDGSPDLTFGDGGHFEIFETSANAITRFFDVAILEDEERIVAAGENAVGHNYFFVGLTPEGQLDPTFAGDGSWAIQTGESQDAVLSVAVDHRTGDIARGGFYRDSAMTGGGTGTALGMLGPDGTGGWAVKVQSPATGSPVSCWKTATDLDRRGSVRVGGATGAPRSGRAGGSGA